MLREMGNSSKEGKKRILYLDVLRIVACTMIVLMHSPSPDANVPGYVQVPLYFLTAAGLVLFFMVSGALLLPINDTSFSWLRRRIGKVIWPLLFWSLFYICDRFIKDGSFTNLAYDIVSLPFINSGHSVLWFLYTLIGLYLLAPIISPWIKNANRKEILFYLLLWFVSLSYPWIGKVLTINDGPQGILYYFTGYVGYFILGYYLHRYGSRLPSWALTLCIVIPFAFLLIFKALAGEGLMSLFWYLSVFVAIMAVAWFEGTRRLLNTVEFSSDLLSLVSNCTFGVYLIHYYIISIIWKSDIIVHGIGGIGQVIITWLIALILSYIITWAISFLPYSEYIIGYSRKKK